jgi:hypothetical protein
MHYPSGGDPHQLLGGRTPAGTEIRIWIADTGLVHPPTISVADRDFGRRAYPPGDAGVVFGAAARIKGG